MYTIVTTTRNSFISPCVQAEWLFAAPKIYIEVYIMICHSEYASSQNGFTIIEILIVSAIISILILISVPSFLSYKQKALIAAGLASASSIQASMNAYTLSETRGSYPAAAKLTGWSDLAGLCNAHGSTLPLSPAQSSFHNWIHYIPVDTDSDSIIDMYYLLVRIRGIYRETPGSQIQISPCCLVKQTY